MAEDASTDHARSLRSGPVIGVDVGRHRLHLADGASHQLVGLRNDGRGMVIRWYGDDGDSQRVIDLLVSCAGSADHPQAEDLAHGLGQLARSSIEDGNRPPAGSGGSVQAIVAIPPALGPAGRRALVDGFDQAGWGLDGSSLVERPVAVLASWLASRNDAGTEPVVVIDNDGGQVSAVVADPRHRRLVACHPLSAGPDDEPELVVARFRALVELGAAVTYDGPMIRPSDWPSKSASIGRVVLAGSGAEHPRLAQLVAAVLPAAPVEIGADPAIAVAIGLTHLDQLTDWRACWPTVSVAASGHVIIPAGPSPGRGEVSIAHADSVGLVVDARPVDVSVGSASAPGIRIGATPGDRSLKVLDDGRLLILDRGRGASVGIRVSWPCPGVAVDHVEVRPIGQRAIELEDERQTGAWAPT